MKYMIEFEYGRYKVFANEWGVRCEICQANTIDEAIQLISCRTGGPVRIGVITNEDR